MIILALNQWYLSATDEVSLERETTGESERVVLSISRAFRPFLDSTTNDIRRLAMPRRRRPPQNPYADQLR